MERYTPGTSFDTVTTFPINFGGQKDNAYRTVLVNFPIGALTYVSFVCCLDNPPLRP